MCPMKTPHRGDDSHAHTVYTRAQTYDVVGHNFARVDFHLAAKRFAHDAAADFLAAVESQVKRVEKPREKLNTVTCEEKLCE